MSGDTPTVASQYDDAHDFTSLLDDAETKAKSEWEETFVSDLKVKWEKYGEHMYLTDSQKNNLERIASR